MTKNNKYRNIVIGPPGTGKTTFLKNKVDAIITKGIVSLLIRTFSNQKPDDIINASLDFIDDIGLRQHLSPNRANGLNNMIKKIKFYAIAFSKTN